MKPSRITIQIYLLNIVFALLLFRTGFIAFKYFFLGFYLLLFCSVLWIYKKQVVSLFIPYIKGTYLIFLSLALFIVSFFISSKLQIVVLKEIIDAVLLLSLFYFAYIIIDGELTLKRFLHSFINIVILFSAFTSVIIIAYENNILGFWYNSPDSIKEGLTLYDYNFSLVPVFISILGILYRYNNTQSRMRSTVYTLLLIFFTFRIILSGSRRGFLLLSGLSISITILYFITVFLKNRNQSRQLSAFFHYLPVFYSLLLAFFLFFNAGYKTKNFSLTLLGVKNIEIIKPEITRKLIRYISLFNKNITFSNFHNKFWSLSFDPKDPASGWGTKPYKPIFPLSGKNVEIVPEGTTGYMLDALYGKVYNDTLYYSDILTEVFTIHAKKGEIYSASVYCFVPENFEGFSARLITSWKAKYDGIILSNPVKLFNLNRKGEWQKLTIEFECIKDGEVPVLLSYNKRSKKSFAELKGHVIFAHPEYKTIPEFAEYKFNPKDPESGWGTVYYRKVFPLTGKNVEIVPEGSIGNCIDSSSVRYYDDNKKYCDAISEVFTINAKTGDVYEASVYCYVSEDFEGYSTRFLTAWSAKDAGVLKDTPIKLYNLGNKGTWQKLDFQFECLKDGNIPVYISYNKNAIRPFKQLKGYVIFAHPEFKKIPALGYNQKFDSKNPESGWGNLYYKPVFPLTGKNVEIVPKGSVGYLLDTLSGNCNNYTKYCDTYSEVFSRNVKKGQKYKATVYCYVSDYNDIEYARIVVGSDAQSNKIINQKSIILYDTEQKGYWQKISTDFECIFDGKVKVYLSYRKNLDKSSDSSNPYVIFAYPEFVRLEFNPKNPETWLGIQKHKTIFPLDGKNSEIVPSGSKGYLVDYSSGTCGEKPGYCDVLTEIFSIHANPDEKYKVSVFCYVSDDFDGMSARIIVGVNAVKEGIIKQNAVQLYNSKNKGTWQKLEIEFRCIKKGTIPVYITFNRNNPTPYQPLNGHVIFAYPSFEKLTSFNNGQLPATSYTFNSDISKSYSKVVSKNKRSNRSLSSMFCFSPKMVVIASNFISQIDPIKSLVNDISSEDTTFYSFKAELNTDFENIDFAEDRVSRWLFAKEIFLHEYTWKQKLVGNGFDSLNWFGYVFSGDKSKVDYPHNPFLHILLYSGIVGLFLYIVLMFYTLWHYIKLRKHYFIFLVFFCLTYFFTFFSGGNPLDPSMNGFFILLPFLINLVLRKQENLKKTAIRN